MLKCLQRQFQSTLPRGERRILHFTLYNVKLFQSTLPRGERLKNFSFKFCFHTVFQSTLPRGERLDGSMISSCVMSFQSTLPRGERRKSRGRFTAFTVISIHAPARGATRQHKTGRRIWINFNPRSREGSDIDTAFDHMIRFNISIHAPARGATFAGISTVPRSHISIHAPARGATPVCATPLTGARFQSTLPRGERRRACMAYTLHSDFNPRSREGSDSDLPAREDLILYFNPRSREGSDFNFI